MGGSIEKKLRLFLQIYLQIKKQVLHLSHCNGAAQVQNIAKQKMTLTEKIKSNPYLKVSNCTDIADLENAMDELRKLDSEYGENKKTLLKLWVKFLAKKNLLSK